MVVEVIVVVVVEVAAVVVYRLRLADRRLSSIYGERRRCKYNAFSICTLASMLPLIIHCVPVSYIIVIMVIALLSFLRKDVMS